MEVIKGNLIKLAKEGHFDMIVHGANCYCTLAKGTSGGIAAQIEKEFPGAAKMDGWTVMGDYNKLGNYSVSVEHVDKLIGDGQQAMMVVNAYTQHEPGADARLNAIEMVFDKLNKNFPGNTVGIPFIGCGIGGLSWRQVRKVIKKVTPDLNIVAVKYNG